MLDPTITTKISSFLQTSITDSLSDWYTLLVAGDLRTAEQQLAECSVQIHTVVLKLLLPAAAQQFEREHSCPAGVRAVRRAHRIRIATGHQVELTSLYYKAVPQDYQGTRRPLLAHWHSFEGSSPLLFDRTGFMAMLAPSYELAHQGLTKFGLTLCLSSVQKITSRLAERCDDIGHENLIVEPDYSLKDKTVVISLDGGRSRVREYTTQCNENGQPTYHTPWREPKLFVIDVLNEQGHADRHELPIYGCQFHEDDVVNLLARYLKKINIHQAARVQLIADGAPWIWNRVPQVLIQAGVPEQRLTQTLDFYHCSEYIHSLVKAMPQRIGKKKRKQLLNEFLQGIKTGQTPVMVGKIKTIFLRPTGLVKRWIRYLEKHTPRMQYAHYKSVGLMCGSGIIESAIRRIINLRFKNASTFWLQENVEKLYFLRAALVAGRWDIVMENLTDSG